jgi:large subunit ribosomal protein L29
VKAAEFQDLDAAEARAKETEIREQIFRLRFQITMGQTDGVKKYRALRKDLARLLTVRRQAELGGAN